MPTALIARYRRWLEYEQDAHAKVLSSLESVPPEGRSTPEYRKAASIFAHIVTARKVWLSRLGVIPAVVGSLFPENAEVGQFAFEWREVHRLWTEYLASLDDAALNRVFEYQSLDAGRFRNRIEDVLAQLYGHSSYHRGQIAMLVRTAGGQPAITDFIYWCREAVTESGR